MKLSLGLGLMTLGQDFHKLDVALGQVGDGASDVIVDLFRQTLGGGGGAGGHTG